MKHKGCVLWVIGLGVAVAPGLWGLASGDQGKMIVGGMFSVGLLFLLAKVAFGGKTKKGKR